MTSKTYKLDIKDVAKGLLIAILTSGLDYLAQSLLLDDFSFKRVLLAGAYGYLVGLHIISPFHFLITKKL